MSFELGPFLFSESSVSMTRIPDDGEWEPAFEYMHWLGRNIYWWIGDMVVLSEKTMGEDNSQIYPESSSLRQIERCRRMSEIYPPEDRIPELSWTHHDIASRLPRSVRMALLRKAAAERLDTQAFRDEVKKYCQ